MEKSDVTESDALTIKRLVEPNPQLEAVRDAEKNSILHKTVNAETLTSGTARETVNYEGDNFSEEPSRLEFSLQDTNKGTDGPSHDNNLHKQPREDRDEIEEADSELHKEHFQKDVKTYPSISAVPKDISQEYGRSAKVNDLTIEETNEKSDDVKFKIPSVHSSPIADADIRDCGEDDEGLSSTQRLGNNEECNKKESKTLIDGKMITDKFITAEKVIVPDSENKDVNIETTDKICSEVVEEKNIGKEILVCNQENQPMSDLRERKISEPSTVNLDGSSPETTDGDEIVEERIEDGVAKKTENDAPLKEAAQQTEEIFDEKNEKGSDEKYFKLADEAETEPTEMGISIVKGKNASEKSIVYEANKDQLEINTTELDKSVQEVIDLSEHIEGTTLDECALEEQNRCIASVEEDPSNHTIQTGYLVNTNPTENSDQMLDENNRETISERQIVEKGETFSEIPVTATNEKIGTNKDTCLENSANELDQRKHEKVIGSVPDKQYIQEIEDGSESEESKSTEKRSTVDKISTSETLVETRVQTKDTENCGFQNPSDFASIEQHTEDDGRKTMEKETETERIHEIQPLEDLSCMPTEEMILETLKSGEEQEEATQKGEASSQMFVSDSMVLQLLVENSVKADETSSDTIDKAYPVAQIPIHNTTDVIELEDRESKGDAQGIEGESEMPTQEQISELSNKIEDAVTGIVKDGNNVVLDTAISGKVINEEATYLRNEKVGEICKEENNVKFELHHTAQLTEKVHPINEEESKKLEKISELNFDEGQYFEKVPDKADPSNKIVRSDVPVVSEDQVREGSNDNEKSSENPEDVSKTTCTETIADIGPIDSGNDDVDDSSIVEASERGKAPESSEVKTKKSPTEGVDEGTSVHQCKKDGPESSSLNSNFIAVSKETEESRANNSIPEKENKDIQGMVLNVEESSQEEEKVYVVEKADEEKSTQEDKKLHISSESVLDDQIEETNSESAATNILDLIDGDNPEKEILMVHQNDESETAKWKDEDNTETNVRDINCDPHQQTEGTISESVDDRHQETTNSGFEEETYPLLELEDKNEDDIKEKNKNTEKLEINSESVPEDQTEELNSEPVATDIHDMIDPDNQEKEQVMKMVNLNDEPTTVSILDSQGLADQTICERVDKLHEETINSGREDDTHQMMNDDNNQAGVQDKNKEIEKLVIISKSASEDQIEEKNVVSVEANIHHLINADHKPETEIITMANLNDESEIVNLKDEDKETIVCDIADSHELAKGTIHDKAVKGHDKNEITNFECQEETLQTVNEDSNEVDIKEEKAVIERLEIASESASENLLEETRSESVATNINDLIDDDNNPETEIIAMGSLNDETEIANLKDEDEETVLCDIADSHELAKGTIHDKAGKGHDEITNFEWQEETQQTVNEDSNEFDIHEEKTVVEMLEIASESASENLREEMRSESVATIINDLIDDDNYPKTEQNITMANLNDETEITSLKDEDKESVVCDISNSHEAAKGATNDKAGKRHDEITNFEGQKETQQTVKAENSNEVDILEEKTDVRNLETNSESASENLFEEMRSESVATNIHDLVDDDNNPETEQIITMANLNDETEIENLKDEDKETVVCDISNSHESDGGPLHDKVDKGHDEITNIDCQEETQQTVNVEDSNEVDILEEKTNVGKLEITSESAFEKLFEETHSESVTTNIHDLIDDDNNPETEQIITMANLNDETEITKLKDEDKETVVCDISNSHESAKGAINDKAGKGHDEMSDFECQEETQQIVNVEDSNEVDILEEKTDVGKLKITSESASENLFESTNIHDLIDDDDNPETEIITMANLNDATEIPNVKDEDKEKVVCDISNSHESAEVAIHDKAGKVHDEIINFDCQEENQQTVNVEDSNEVDILEEKTDVGKLEITSESASKNLFEETRSESVTTNVHDLIDDDNNPETEQNITMANLNDETEKAKLKDEDTKETVVCDTFNSHESVGITVHDKAGEVHDETIAIECQQENQQSVSVEDSNEVDIQEEKTDVEKLETILESKSENLIEETRTESVATNIHELIDDDNNPETELITTMANLNDETEISKMKEEDNKEMYVCEFVEGTIHDKVGRRHEETDNFECQEETRQTVKAVDSNEVGNHEENKNVKKPEISSKSVPEDQTEEKNSVPVVTNIHDLIDDGNIENEKIIKMVNLNDEPETAKLKNEENKEPNAGDISDSCEMAEKMIHDKVGKRHEETTNSVCEEETSQIISAEDKHDAHNQEERSGTEKFETNAIETNSESVATSTHDAVDDDNSRKEIVEMENLNDNPGSAIVKDEYNQEQNIGNISDTQKSVEGTICDVLVKQHEETTYTAYEKNINQNTVSKEATEVVAYEEGESTKKHEMISDALAEDQVQEMTCAAETMQIESTLGDCTSSKGVGGLFTVSEMIYEDKKQKEPLPDFASSEARGNMDNQLAEKDKTYETSVTTYESNSQEKPKVFSMYDSTDGNQPKEQTSETILENPSSSPSEGLEESSGAFDEKQIKEYKAIIDDDSVGIRYETVDERSRDNGNNQIIDDGVSEITYRDQGDRSDEIHDKKRSPGHLNEESENVNVNDEEESEDKRLNGLPVGNPLADEAAPQNDEKESTTKLADLTDMILNNENLEARSKIMISQDDNYENVDTETLTTNYKESKCKNVQNSPVIPTPVGETSEAIEERHEKAPRDPSEEQIHQGINEIDVNTTGSGVSEEDISESALSTSQDFVKEKTSTTYFSAEGDDGSHQEREHSKGLEITYSEEAKTMPNKQPQDIEVGKPNEECEFSCEENINSLESEKNKEEDKTDTEKAITVRLGTSSNMAYEEPEAAIQTEPPWEQTKVATEAVRGNVKAVAESIITSQENSETKSGKNSIEVDDERHYDTVNDFSSANEASAERNIQKNASDEELEGLIHDIAVDRDSMSEDETNNKQDGCVSSETKALEDETQDGVQLEKKVCQRIEGGESDKKESSEEKKTSEKNHSDVNFGKSLQEDENKEHEKVFVSDAAEGATSDELKLASMIGCEKVEEMDAINKNTEKMVIGYSDTDTSVEPTNVAASGYHSQMDKKELSTLENIAVKFQSVGTEDGEKHERTEELNTKLQEDSEELTKYEHIPTIVLEGVKAAESSEKTERKITVEEDISEAPSAYPKQETEDGHFPEDGTKVQKKESQTKCEIETTHTMVVSSALLDKEFDSTPSKNFSRTIFTNKAEPLKEKLDEQKIFDATPDAYIETEIPHEQFQKDDIVGDNDKTQQQWELDSTNITKNQPPNDEVKELDCKPSEESVDLEDETSLFVDLEDEKKNLDAAPGACVKDEISCEQLRKDELDKEHELGIEKKKTQTTWEPNFIDKENKSPNNNVEVWDCIPTEQNTVIAFTEKLDTTILTNDEGDKQCFDATIDACMKDETSHAQFLKDGIKAEKNNERETRWELQSTDDTEFDSLPSEESTFTTVWTEKIRNLLTEEEVKKNVGVAASSCAKHETNHEPFQTDDIAAEKNKEPYNKRELERTYAEANESPNNEVKELDYMPPEEDSSNKVLIEKIKTALSMGEMEEKKNIDACPGACVKDETTNEQFQKDETEVNNNKELQTKWQASITDPKADKSPDNEVNELHSNFPEHNSMTIPFTNILDTGILMDEGNEEKNLALPHTTRPAEEIAHEVDPTNVVSKYMRSRSTQDEVIAVNLSKETSPEDPTEVHKLDVTYADTGSIEKPINIDDITHDVNDRGEKVPEWTPIGVQVSENSRIETLSKDEREWTGEESNLDSKMEGTQQTEEDSNEGLQFDVSQDEEKHRDCDDLPVSRLLLQHILRSNSDIQDQATKAGPEEIIQEMNGKRIACTGVEKQGETFSDELEDSHETLEDTSQLLHKEDILDVKQNTANAVVREAETPQNSMSSPSLSESKDITDNERISKEDSISVSLPLKQVTDGTRFSEDKACPDELENTSDLVIDEVNHDIKEKTEISEVKDDKNQNNLHNSSIFTVEEGVKDEVSSLMSDVSTRENAPTATENHGKSTTPDLETYQKDHSTIDEKMTNHPENLRKDFDVSSMDKNYQVDNSHTKAEEKSISVSETVGHTECILQSEETETNPQYNQNTKSYEPMSETHVHANEQASEIKPDATITKEELGEQNDDEITERVQNVDNYSSEEPNVSYSQEDQQSNTMSESTNETLQTAARPLEERTTEISKDENQTKERADSQTEEDKTDEEKDEIEGADDHKIEDGGQNVAVTVEARDAGSKKAHKKSHNILSGVGSKVKNSLAKVKKAIIGKSSQPKAATPK